MPPRGQKRLHDGRSILHVDPANLKPEELEVLHSLETIWDDPNGLEKLRTFKWMFDLLLSACKSSAADSTVPATFFDSVIAAKEAVGVDYHQHGPQHDWQLRESSDLSDGRLSQWADECITAITTSKYYERSESESICRTVIDVIFCDRLNYLDDHNADRQLNWFPEMSISTRSNLLGKTIQGKVDWCLSHGNNKTEVDTTLVVLEAKRLGSAQSGLPQLIIYLAAVQDRRKQTGKRNCSTFGILSDSSLFIFAHLDSHRKLFVSRPHSWHSEKVKIIQWIDRLLADAIHASPHTTPVKSGNTSLMAYRNFLDQGYHFGPQDASVEIFENQTIRRYAINRALGSGYLVAPMDDAKHDNELENTSHSG